MHSMIVLCCLVVPFPIIQPPRTVQAGTPPTNGPTAPPKAPVEPKGDGSAFVVVCDAKPGQMIVLDSTGQWVSGVKVIKLDLEVGQVPSISCIIYEGQYRPSKPTTKTWVLTQIKTVSAADFQQMIDSLQTDPNAIRAMLKKGE